MLDNINIMFVDTLRPPSVVKMRLPLTERCVKVIETARKEIVNILTSSDKRLLVVIGPCSIHDPQGAMEYAQRLVKLHGELGDVFLFLLRAYFEKPRTIIGWKGFVNDPFMNGSCDIDHGLSAARTLLLNINELGLPVATEFLDPVTPQYLADLISWGAIGARTTESQTHREMASGLSMPIGFKNGTNGDLDIAINAMMSARSPHSFTGINPDGVVSKVTTSGNPFGHIVLRGGGGRTNYDKESIANTVMELKKHKLPGVVMVDCSHANSGKDYKRQPDVFKKVIRQRVVGNKAIVGVMIESNLLEGSQTIPADPSNLRYGVSVTDGCIGWDMTKKMLCAAHDRLSKA